MSSSHGKVSSPGAQIIVAAPARFGSMLAQFANVLLPRAVDVSGAPTLILPADTGGIPNGFIDIFTIANGCASDGIAVRAGERWTFDITFNAQSSAANVNGFDVQITAPLASLFVLDGSLLGNSANNSRGVYSVAPPSTAILAGGAFDSSAGSMRPSTLQVVAFFTADGVVQMQLRNNAAAGTHIVLKGAVMYGTRTQ